MAAARPLKDVFADLTGDGAARPDDALAAGGHGDLPADLVAEAVVSFAGTAPLEVAEHLAPYVTAHSGVPVETAGSDDWAGLLATAPVGETDFDAFDAPPEAAPEEGVPDVDFGGGAGDEPPSPADDEVEPADAAVDVGLPAPTGEGDEVDDGTAVPADLPVALSDVDDTDADDVDPAGLDG